MHRLTAVVATCSLAASAMAQSYAGLGFLPGGEFSHAAATNADGRVVAGWAGTGSAMTAVRWSAFTGLRPLAGLPGCTDSFASGVSSNGDQLCGWSVVNGSRRATLWDPGMQPVDLGLLPGGTWSQALAISEDGATVIGAANTSTRQHAFVWTAAGGMRPLPDPAGAQAESAVALRGVYVVGTTDAPGGVPVRWTSMAQPTLLNIPEGAVGAIGADIDSAGRVYGGSVSFQPYELGTIWAGTTDAQIAPIDNFQNTVIHAVSAGGSLYAGRAMNYTVAGLVGGQSVGTARPLAGYLTQLGVPQRPNTLDCPTAVSDDGKVVVGAGWNAGRREGFVARLPGAVAACPPDIGATGGVSGPDGALDNNDFIAFINFFFLGDPRADLGIVGGVPGHDGRYDNNDFVVFIDQFFSGCP